MKARRTVNPVLLALIALMLTVIWLPQPFALARPLWALLLIIYLQVSLPARFSVSAMVVLGLTMDVLCPNVMGVHALALTIPSFYLAGRARRFHFFTVLQQMLWVGALSLVYQLILALLAYSLGYAPSILAICLPVISTLLLWPWLSYFLDHLFLRVRA